jgi:hypothetical protein
MDVKVNKAQWDGLPADERTKIQSIIGSHFKDTNIVGDHNVKSAEDTLSEFTLRPFNFTNPLCTAGCGIAEAGAVAACSALSGGVLVAVCVAAAHAAGDVCRSRC